MTFFIAFHHNYIHIEHYFEKYFATPMIYIILCTCYTSASHGGIVNLCFGCYTFCFQQYSGYIKLDHIT